MAYDKAVDSTKLDAGLTAIADAIRAKGGTTELLDFPQGMADAVAAISGGDSEKGEFTLASDTNTVVIPTSKKRRMIAIRAELPSYDIIPEGWVKFDVYASLANEVAATFSRVSYNAGTMNDSWGGRSSSFYAFDEDKIRTRASATFQWHFKANVKYLWEAW